MLEYHNGNQRHTFKRNDLGFFLCIYSSPAQKEKKITFCPITLFFCDNLYSYIIKDRKFRRWCTWFKVCIRLRHSNFSSFAIVVEYSLSSILLIHCGQERTWYPDMSTVALTSALVPTSCYKAEIKNNSQGFSHHRVISQRQFSQPTSCSSLHLDWVKTVDSLQEALLYWLRSWEMCFLFYIHVLDATGNIWRDSLYCVEVLFASWTQISECAQGHGVMMVH